MATRFMYKALSTAALGIALSPLLAATTAASPASSNTVAQPVSDQTSTVFDPVGDAYFHNAPAFQDVVFGQMTKTASGDFELLMKVAGPVPVAPTLPPSAPTEIWWLWTFDLDPTAFPAGYPGAPGYASAAGVEFSVYVRWDGTEFAGIAIDRRPLLTGGEAIITPVPFSINGTILEADLAYELIGDVPPSFRWSVVTLNWAGPVGSVGHLVIDSAGADFNP